MKDMLLIPVKLVAVAISYWEITLQVIIAIVVSIMFVRKAIELATEILRRN